MLVVVAVMKVRAGMEQEMENAFKSMIPKVEAEEGTHAYTLHRGKKEPAKFLLYEKYTNKEALALHTSTPYFKELIQKINPMLDGTMAVDMYEDVVGIAAKK